MRARTGSYEPEVGSSDSFSAPVPGQPPNPFGAIQAVRQKIANDQALKRQRQAEIVRMAHVMAGGNAPRVPSDGSPGSASTSG